MIKLTLIDGSEIIINADEIETVESRYDTTVSLISGKKIIIRESGQEIIDKVIEYRRQCNLPITKLPEVKD